MTARQQVDENGRYPCRFDGCNKTFAYDGKSRNAHEASHEPPVVVTTALLTSDVPQMMEEASQTDDMFKYNVCLARYGLLCKELYDAIQEGDGERIFTCWKFLLLHLRADGKGSAKYALEALYYILQTISLLSPRQAYRLKWNCSVKGKYTNVPLDLHLEHDNRMVKEAIKKLSGNITEKSVNRIVKAQAIAREMLHSFDRTMHVIRRSGKHFKSSDEKDFKKILSNLVKEEALSRKEGRHYTHFRTCKSSILDELDVHKMHQWINEHKKKISGGQYR